MARQQLDYFDDPLAVGTRVREARERAALTQRDLAFPGCTAAYISRIERGERVPSLQILREFARRLGVTEDFLARGADPDVRLPALVEAEALLRLGSYGEAEALLADALATTIDESERARVLAVLGEIALHTSDPRTAIELLEQAVRSDPRLEEKDPRFGEVLGRAYARAADYAAAITVFERNRGRAAASGDLLNETRYGALLANALADSGNFGAAEQLVAHVVDLADAIGDPLARARLLWSQSRLRTLQHDADGASRYAHRALELLEGTDHAYYAAVAHQLLAHIELDRGNPEAALDLLDRATVLVDQSGRRYDRALLRLERARAFLALGERDQAAAIAMEAAGTLNDASPLDAGRSYCLIAGVFSALGDTDRAIELYELAVEALKRTPNRYLVEAYTALAELLEATGDKDRAFEVLKDAMQVQKESGRMLAGAAPI